MILDDIHLHIFVFHYRSMKKKKMDVDNLSRQSVQSYALRKQLAACIERAERESLCSGMIAKFSWPPE